MQSAEETPEGGVSTSTPSWLAAPERAWPVVVDPTVTIFGATHDTYVASGHASPPSA